MGTIDCMSRGPHHNMWVLGVASWAREMSLLQRQNIYHTVGTQQMIVTPVVFTPFLIVNIHQGTASPLAFHRMLFSIFDFKSWLHQLPAVSLHSSHLSSPNSKFAGGIKNKMCAKNHFVYHLRCMNVS